MTPYRCQRVGCRRLGHAKSPYDARHAKYCSRRCAGLAGGRLTEVVRALGQAASRNAKRATARARFTAMTTPEIYALAYKRGWNAGMARAERRFLET